MYKRQDVVHQLVNVIVEPLLPLHRTPDLHAVLDEPFYNEWCFIIPSSEPVKHEHKMCIRDRGIMQAALNGTDPCVIFESQRIYGKGEEFHEGGVPAEEYEWAPGAVNKVRDGKDLTILTIGATLYRAVDAAKTLSEKYGIEADVINMPSLVPLDYTDLIASVKKTGRVVLASDACARGTFLNEIAENLTNMCFDYLDAPPVVIGARNWITPPHEFDKYFFPYAEWIIDAVNARLIPLEGYTSTTTPDEAEIIRRNKLGV